mgnify:CR=1 FL=1
MTALFLIGDDERSRAWLRQRQAALRELQAVGLVVNVESMAALTALRRLAPGLIPPPGQKAIPMDRMRDLILGGFEPDAAPGGCASGCLAVK